MDKWLGKTLHFVTQISNNISHSLYIGDGLIKKGSPNIFTSITVYKYVLPKKKG